MNRWKEAGVGKDVEPPALTQVRCVRPPPEGGQIDTTAVENWQFLLKLSVDALYNPTWTFIPHYTLNET